MATWAASGKFPNAAFLCICVDPDALYTAKEFAQLYFGRAPDTLINGFIDSRPDFPNFPSQLGCQGFILYDSGQKLVATKTLPFNEYRDRAFHDVEGKLSPLLQVAAPQNLPGAETLRDSFDVEEYLNKVTSVGHDAMDAQHNALVDSLLELAKQLTVKELQRVKQELEAHFDEEEDLLKRYAFGAASLGGRSDIDQENDFSAFGSHARDHKRIVAMAEGALSKLQNVCDQSDAHGGTVPKVVAEELCKAFVEHASMFDSLYEGKLFDRTVMEKVVGWYNFTWKGGSFPVCFRPEGSFFCHQYQAPATWTMVEDVIKIDWGQFGRYELKFNEVERSMAGHEIPKDDTNENNWRSANFLHDLSDAEKVLFGEGAGTEWELAWKEGKFPIKFQADGYNHFVCDDFPARAHWTMQGHEIVIHWGHLGKYRLILNPSSKTMEGGELYGDQSKDTWWRKATHIRNLPISGVAESCDRH